ncbi:MAG: hypothetical protein OMM_01855 [Candidatus Magnetoglobus multicellularis str. Araruama]|uniref:Uncharacterized protein n=1 Tax=Candidatus Magnetoglobus multicellularis str. Araruama TaxID=890399 RepID=A0A1V1PBW5_9BACT|nr:MAG: hypothetical protein OMM_01855 [Candidatus Magnetoglobus multicellularis str. Araruama]
MIVQGKLKKYVPIFKTAAKGGQMKNHKKIIFLDIDGVIQPPANQFRFACDMDTLQKCMAREHNAPLYMDIHKYDLAAAYCDWDEEAVENLRTLVEQTNAKIVISSDWRSFNDTEKMKLLFKIYDMDEYIIDVTAEGLKYCFRDGECAEYLFRHPDVTQFVIIDDRYSRDFKARYPDNFVHTDQMFEKEDLQKALSILNRAPSDKKLNKFKKQLEKIRKNNPKFKRFEISLENYSLMRHHLQIGRADTLDVIFDGIAENTHLTDLCVTQLSHDFRESDFKKTVSVLDEKLGQVLAKNASIKTLKIPNGFSNIKNILEGLTQRKTPLEYLDLESNYLDDKGMKDLANYIESIDSPLKLNLVGALYQVSYDLYMALKKNLNVTPRMRTSQLPVSKPPKHFDMVKESFF